MNQTLDISRDHHHVVTNLPLRTTVPWISQSLLFLSDGFRCSRGSSLSTALSPNVSIDRPSRKIRRQQTQAWFHKPNHAVRGNDLSTRNITVLGISFLLPTYDCGKHLSRQDNATAAASHSNTIYGRCSMYSYHHHFEWAF
jgi:hypothetical protein